MRLNRKQATRAAIGIFMAGLACTQTYAQAVPTASANVRISAFAGLSANYTGLLLAKNGDLTAGVDIGFRPFHSFYPALEGRGFYPIDKGQTVNLENFVGGLRLGRRKERFGGYGDVLFGRGKLSYPGGYPDASNTFLVVSNTSNVISFGGGVDWDWTPHFGLKGDFQLQRYDTPVTASGNLISKVFTIGMVYRLGSGRVR